MSEQHGNLIERLSAIPYTGVISDILDETGLRDQVLSWQIQPLDPADAAAGRALTVIGTTAEDSDPDVIFRPVLEMLGGLQPGDFIASQANDNVSARPGERQGWCCGRPVEEPHGGRGGRNRGSGEARHPRQTTSARGIRATWSFLMEPATIDMADEPL